MLFHLFILVVVSSVWGEESSHNCEKIVNKAGIYLIRTPTNCSLYDVCNGRLRVATASCGTGLVFSNTYSVCVRRNGPYDDCKKKAPAGGFYNDDLCNPKPTGLNVDPSDCSRYIPCFNGTSKPSMPCQQNLYFDFKEQRCVEKDKVQCTIEKKES